MAQYLLEDLQQSYRPQCLYPQIALIHGNRPILSSSTLLACHYCLVSGENSDRFVRGSCYNSKVTRAAALLSPLCACSRVSVPTLSVADIYMHSAVMCTHIWVCHKPDIFMLSAFT